MLSAAAPLRDAEDGEGLAESEPVRDVLLLTTPVVVSVMVNEIVCRLGEGVKVDGVGENDGEAVSVGRSERVPVVLNEAEGRRLEDMEHVGVPEGLGVFDSCVKDEAVAVKDGLMVRVVVGVCVGNEGDGVGEWLLESEPGLWDMDTESLGDDVHEVVGDWLWGLPDIVSVPVPEWEGESEADPLGVAVTEWENCVLVEMVLVTVFVLLKESLLTRDLVAEGERVCEEQVWVPLREQVRVGMDREYDVEPVREGETVRVGRVQLTVPVGDDEGEAEAEELSLIVQEHVSATEGLCDPEVLLEDVRLQVTVAAYVAVAVPVTVSDADRLRLGPRDTEREGVRVPVRENVADLLPAALSEAVPETD